MDLASIIGIIVCVGGLLAGFAMEGGNPGMLAQPSAAVIVFGGTIGACMFCAPLGMTINLWKVTLKAFMRKGHDTAELIEKFVAYAEKVRREGLLVLEEDANNEHDPFLRSGLQLVIDGNDTDLVRDILRTEVKHLTGRHGDGAHYFDNMGGFAPTFGIVGTVMGLVLVLSNLSDPSSLGGAVAAAFIATLYGVFSANAIFLPLANKLRHASHEEAVMREIMIEGILSIQAGDNPRIVKEKLSAFLSPGERAKLAVEGKD
jgi:chemotaxis protein MotA